MPHHLRTLAWIGSIAVVPSALLSVRPPAEPPVFAPVEVYLEDANPGREILRGECITIPTHHGQIQCDDFVYRYPLLPVMRLNTPRTLTLIYNSATSYQRPIVGANVKLTTHVNVDTVKGKL